MKGTAKQGNLYQNKHIHELHDQECCTVPSSVWKNNSQLHRRLNAWRDQDSKTRERKMFYQNIYWKLERSRRAFNNQKGAYRWRRSTIYCWTQSIVLSFIHCTQFFNERIILLPARYHSTQWPETCRNSLRCMTCGSVNVSNTDRDHAPTRRRNDHRKADEAVSSYVLNKWSTDVQHVMNIRWTDVEHLQNKWCIRVHRWRENLQQTCDVEQEVSSRYDTEEVACVNYIVTKKEFTTCNLNRCWTGVEQVMNTTPTRKGKERKEKKTYRYYT